MGHGFHGELLVITRGYIVQIAYFITPSKWFKQCLRSSCSPLSSPMFLYKMPLGFNRPSEGHDFCFATKWLFDFQRGFRHPTTENLQISVLNLLLQNEEHNPMTGPDKLLKCKLCTGHKASHSLVEIGRGIHVYIYIYIYVLLYIYIYCYVYCIIYIYIYIYIVIYNCVYIIIYIYILDLIGSTWLDILKNIHLLAADAAIKPWELHALHHNSHGGETTLLILSVPSVELLGCKKHIQAFFMAKPAETSMFHG